MTAQDMGVGLESRVRVESFPGTGPERATFPLRTERTKLAIALIRQLRDGEEMCEEVLMGLKSRFNGCE